MANEQVKSFIDTIGHDNLTDIGMPDRTVRHAQESGYFAARWFWPLTLLAQSRGVPCPPSMFRWAVRADELSVLAKQSGTDAEIVQGGETI